MLSEQLPTFQRLKRGAGFALAVLIAIVLVASLAFKLSGRIRLAGAQAAFVRDVGSLDLLSFERPEVPKAENAAHYLEAGARALVLPGTAQTLSGPALRSISQWRAAELRLARASIDGNAQAIALLHEAATRTRSNYNIPYRQGSAARIPNLRDLRLASDLLLIDARVAFEGGDRSRALLSCRTSARLAASLEDESLLITAIMGIFAERTLYGLTAEWVADQRLTPADAAFLGEVQASIPGNDPLASVRRALGLEMAFVASDDALLWSQVEPARVASWPFREHSRAVMLEYAHDLLPRLSTPVASSERPSFSLSSFSWPGLGVLRDAVPSFELASRMAQQAASARQIAQAALELRRVGLTSRSYPRERTAVPALGAPLALTGRPPSFVAGDDGSITLGLDVDPATLPGSPELRQATFESLSKPPFRIVLPPVR
jgi:hypothetical protein